MLEQLPIREKIILSGITFLLCALVWFNLLAPTLSQRQECLNELNKQENELNELKQKLTKWPQILSENQNLLKEIDSLRQTVPKLADIDLLLIDLEKMSLDSELEFVSIEEAKIQPAAQITEKSKKTDAANKSEKSTDKTKAGHNVKNEEAVIDTGLAKQILHITAQGSYASYIAFFKELAAYQRIIGVKEVTINFAPQKGEKVVNSKVLQGTFDIVAYYFP